MLLGEAPLIRCSCSWLVVDFSTCPVSIMAACCSFLVSMSELGHTFPHILEQLLCKHKPRMPHCTLQIQIQIQSCSPSLFSFSPSLPPSLPLSLSLFLSFFLLSLPFPPSPSLSVSGVHLDLSLRSAMDRLPTLDARLLWPVRHHLCPWSPYLAAATLGKHPIRSLFDRVWWDKF